MRSSKNRSVDSNGGRMRPEWGSETGVDGRQHSRLVELNELRNYRRITHNGFNFYLSIVDTKHPKFIRNTDRGVERWRMRFNVWSTGVLAEWAPNTVLHYGELHVYYDLLADRPKPWCHDFTFYYDDRPLDVDVIDYRYKQMEWAFKDSLVGANQLMKYMLFLPVQREDIVSGDKTLDEFLERQEVIVSQHRQLSKPYTNQTLPNIPNHNVCQPYQHESVGDGAHQWPTPASAAAPDRCPPLPVPMDVEVCAEYS